MSLEGHTEAVWCVKMMVDQGLMLTGFSLPFSVSKKIVMRYCKMQKLKLANVLTKFSMTLFIFNKNNSMKSSLGNETPIIIHCFLFFLGFFFLAFSSYHMSVIKLSVKVQFVPLMNLFEKLSTSVTIVKTHNYNVRIIRNLPNNSKENY